jgi:hypothetical protein
MGSGTRLAPGRAQTCQPYDLVASRPFYFRNRAEAEVAREI